MSLTTSVVLASVAAVGLVVSQNPVGLVTGKGLDFNEALAGKAIEPLQPLLFADKGRYVVVEGVGHPPFVNAPETQTAIKEFLREF